MTTAAHAPAPAGRREIFLAAAVTLLVLLPFAGKAFHIDDTLFLKAARQIRVHPLDFYGFSANWFGTGCPVASSRRIESAASWRKAASTVSRMLPKFS